MPTVACLLCKADPQAIFPLGPYEENFDVVTYSQEWALSGCRDHLAMHVSAKPDKLPQEGWHTYGAAQNFGWQLARHRCNRREQEGPWSAHVRSVQHRQPQEKGPAADEYTHGRMLAWQRLIKSTMPERATTVVGSIFSRCSVAIAV